MSNTTQTATQSIGEWVAEHRPEGVPNVVTQRAKASIIDTIGCMLAGVDEPVTHIAGKFVSEFFDPLRCPRSWERPGGRRLTRPPFSMGSVVMRWTTMTSARRWWDTQVPLP